jgi:hypothetical protein
MSGFNDLLPNGRADGQPVGGTHSVTVSAKRAGLG